MKKLWNHPLGREIIVILGIKFVLIFMIWWAFFSGTPSSPIPVEQVRNTMLAPNTFHDNH